MPSIVRSGPIIPCPFIIEMKSWGEPKSGAPMVIPFAIVIAIVKSAVWFGSLQMAGRLGLTPGAGVEVDVAVDAGGGGVAVGAAPVPPVEAGAVPGFVAEHRIPRRVSGFAVFTLTAPCPHTVMSRFFGLIGSGST